MSLGVARGIYGRCWAKQCCEADAALLSSSLLLARSQDSYVSSSSGTEAYCQFGLGRVDVELKPITASSASGHSHFDMEAGGPPAQAA